MLEQRVAQWEQEFIRKGMLIGREEGIQKGLTLGREEGIANQKNLLLEMLARRFGEFPCGWEKIIKAITDDELIDELMLCTVTSGSLEEFGEVTVNHKPPSSLIVMLIFHQQF